MCFFFVCHTRECVPVHVVFMSGEDENEALWLLPSDMFTTVAPMPALQMDCSMFALYNHIEHARWSADALQATLQQLTRDVVCGMPSETRDTLKVELLFQVCTSIAHHMRSVSADLTAEQHEHVQRNIATLCTVRGAATPRLPQQASQPPPPPPWKCKLPHAFLMPILHSDADVNSAETHIPAYKKQDGGFAVLAADATRLGALMSKSDGILLHFFGGVVSHTERPDMPI